MASEFLVSWIYFCDNIINYWYFFGPFSRFYRGTIDSIIMWLVNVIWSIPTLLMVIAITVSLGKDFGKFSLQLD